METQRDISILTGVQDSSGRSMQFHPKQMKKNSERIFK